MQTSTDNKYLASVPTPSRNTLLPCASQEVALSFLTHAKGCCHIRPEHSPASGVTALHPLSMQTDTNPI